MTCSSLILVQDLVAVDFGIAVDLVEDEDDRLLGFAKLGEGFDLGALHIAGDDEEKKVAMAGDVAGHGFADFAADLVDAGCVDHDQAAPFETGATGCVVLPALGGALDGCAMRRADREYILTHERIQDRRLAAADHAEGGDFNCGFLELLAELAQLRKLACERVSSSGVRFKLARVASRLSLAGDGLVFTCDLTFQLAQDFFELGVSHKKSLSLMRCVNRLLAPLGRVQEGKFHGPLTDVLKGHRQAVRGLARPGTRRWAGRRSSRAS